MGMASNSVGRFTPAHVFGLFFASQGCGKYRKLIGNSQLYFSVVSKLVFPCLDAGVRPLLDNSSYTDNVPLRNNRRSHDDAAEDTFSASERVYCRFIEATQSQINWAIVR